MSVHHRRDLQYGVTLSQGAAVLPSKNALLDLAEKLQPLVDRVHAGHEVDWNGSNMVGKLNEDAQEAEEEINYLFDRLAPDEWTREGVVIMPADEWIHDTRFDDITATMTDEELEAVAAEYERAAKRDGAYLIGSVLEALKEAREELKSDLDCEI